MNLSNVVHAPVARSNRNDGKWNIWWTGYWTNNFPTPHSHSAFTQLDGDHLHRRRSSQAMGTMTASMTITADEVNCLIHAYFQDSGVSPPRYSGPPLSDSLNRLPPLCILSTHGRPAGSLTSHQKTCPTWRTCGTPQQGSIIH